jgi:hypothetical protein
MTAAMPSSTPPFSIGILSMLVLIFLASLAVFFVLVHRWTHGVRRHALREWARRTGFRAAIEGFPTIVGPVIAHAPLVNEQFVGGPVTILRLQTTGGAWHILVRKLETPWPATGVRPVANTSSLLDLYALASFPSLTTGERFIVYGTDSSAARALAKSSLAALLPKDIGLMIAQQEMLLDFTTRPFDEIEFNRMIALADQLVAHLPAVGNA